MIGYQIGIALCGAGLGLGLIFGVLAFWRPRPTLQAQLHRLNTRPSTPPAPTSAADGAATGSGMLGRAGAWAAGPLMELGLPRVSTLRRLALLGRSPRAHVAEQAGTAILTAAAALGAASLAAVAGAAGLAAAAAIGAVPLAAAAFLLPDLAVAEQARRAAQDWRHALSAFLDLSAIFVAGGAGVETALRDAAQSGNSPAFARIRGALNTADLTSTSPWRQLGVLSDEVGINELNELAATMTLAGTEGARVKQSLAAKASTLRTHQLYQAETAAQSATERMSLPVVLLFVAFLIFIGYPAITAVLSGL